MRVGGMPRRIDSGQSKYQLEATTVYHAQILAIVKVGID